MTKALLATAAIVVIATCGYFVYDDRQSKAAEAAAEEAAAEEAEARRSHLYCLENLRDQKEMLEGVNMWEGKTHGERIEAFETHPRFKRYSALLSSSFDYSWEKCGNDFIWNE